MFPPELIRASEREPRVKRQKAHEHAGPVLGCGTQVVREQATPERREIELDEQRDRCRDGCERGRERGRRDRVPRALVMLRAAREHGLVVDARRASTREAWGARTNAAEARGEQQTISGGRQSARC